MRTARGHPHVLERAACTPRDTAAAVGPGAVRQAWGGMASGEGSNASIPQPVGTFHNHTEEEKDEKEEEEEGMPTADCVSMGSGFRP